MQDTKIEFFDSNFWFGENYLSSKYTLLEDDAIKILIKRKEDLNITHTLITNLLGFYSNPKVGNDQISRILVKEDFKLVGAFGVLFMEHEYFFKTTSFGNWIEKKHKEGFRLLRLAPKTHKYSYDASLFNSFYDILNYYNFPIIINIEEMDITGNKDIEWEKLIQIANSYENIPIILDGGASKELMYNSYLFSVLNNSSNIFIETHDLLGFNQIEDLTEFDSAERLIFGSYFPFFQSELSVSRILNSTIKIKDKKKIASENLTNIIDNIII